MAERIITFQLISAIKSGYRPVISDVSQVLTPLIMLSWQQDDSFQPCASRVLQLLEGNKNNLLPTSLDKHDVGDFSTIAVVSTSELAYINIDDNCDRQVTLEDEQLLVEVANDSQCESNASLHENSDDLHITHVESGASSQEYTSTVAVNEHGETLRRS